VERSLVAAHPDVQPAVAAQRARLLEAITQAVAERGYAAATVADVVRIARVSRGTFYALFDSKEGCYLEAYRLGVDVLVERIATAATQAPGWRAGLDAGLRTYLKTLANEPVFARVHVLEVHAAGPAAQAARDAALRRFADRYAATFRAAAKEDPSLRVPSRAACFVLAAGVDQLVAAHVREHGLDTLVDLVPTLSTTALSLLYGTPGGT
jgi:AcrR family transcriptional regulator